MSGSLAQALALNEKVEDKPLDRHATHLRDASPEYIDLEESGPMSLEEANGQDDLLLPANDAPRPVFTSIESDGDILSTQPIRLEKIAASESTTTASGVSPRPKSAAHLADKLSRKALIYGSVAIASCITLAAALWALPTKPSSEAQASVHATSEHAAIVPASDLPAAVEHAQPVPAVQANEARSGTSSTASTQANVGAPRMETAKASPLPQIAAAEVDAHREKAAELAQAASEPVERESEKIAAQRIRRAIAQGKIRALDDLLIAADSERGAKNFDRALTYCDDLNHSGFTDWHLPSIAKLAILAETRLIGRRKYWSTVPGDPTGRRMLILDGKNSKISSIGRNFRSGRAICVRHRR
jgi:hypothetical protein